MQRTVSIGWLILASAGFVSAAEMQGVIADWNCVRPMVRDGRGNTLKNNRSCSLMKNYDRAAYGLITDDKKFYKLDDPGNNKIRQLLKDTPDKDNLKVVVTGDIQDETMKVINISEL
jgi:hypothetical protein